MTPITRKSRGITGVRTKSRKSSGYLWKLRHKAARRAKVTRETPETVYFVLNFLCFRKISSGHKRELVLPASRVECQCTTYNASFNYAQLEHEFHSAHFVIVLTLRSETRWCIIRGTSQCVYRSPKDPSRRSICRLGH